MNLIVIIGGADLGIVFDVARLAGPGEAAALACEAGSRVCRGRGCVEAIPTWRGFAVPVRMGR